MIILGLNAYHGDAAACVLRDGALVAAVEEERFRRIKHWAGFPSESIRYCLAEAGVALAEVNHIAINSDPKASLWRRLAFAALSRPDPKLILDRLLNQRRRSSVQSDLETAFPGQAFHGAVHRVEHHLAHMASAFFASPFPQAAVVSIDGFGDFASAAWGRGDDDGLSLEGRVSFPHSLGAFYQAITQFIGFPHYGDEYKIMGLAPYGAPRFMDEMRRIVRLHDDGSFSLDLSYFRHHKEKIAYQWRDGAPHVGALYSDALEDLLGPPRRDGEALDQRFIDIARSAQTIYEETLFHLLGKLHARYGEDSLALAGGCAMNSVANGKITLRTPFKRLYIPAAAGDSGGAVGAALHIARQVERPTDVAARFIDHAYWGPQDSADSIKALLQRRSADIAAASCAVATVSDEAQLFRLTAETIAAGRVVGWFQGRMEWGPRALGARSIVCDPRRADMKQILNAKIKRRESFRPFAPSILAEQTGEWFEIDADVPFMTQVFQIRNEKRAQIPAVTHVDGSGRLQTVKRTANPRYYGLISAFHALTGVPMVLNTSFNENEPIVCRAEEALDCFLRTSMDVLVLGDVMLTRDADSGNAA